QNIADAINSHTTDINFSNYYGLTATCTGDKLIIDRQEASDASYQVDVTPGAMGFIFSDIKVNNQSVAVPPGNPITFVVPDAPAPVPPTPPGPGPGPGPSGSEGALFDIAEIQFSKLPVADSINSLFTVN